MKRPKPTTYLESNLETMGEEKQNEMLQHAAFLRGNIGITYGARPVNWTDEEKEAVRKRLQRVPKPINE